MYKPALVCGSIFAMLSVIFGAFGAHYLKTIFTSELLTSFDTGVRYQFYHAMALLFIGVFAQHVSTKIIQIIFWLFLIGIILFSGSIYLLCFLKSANTIGITSIGILTPLGGLCFIAAWGALTMAMLKLHETK